LLAALSGLLLLLTRLLAAATLLTTLLLTWLLLSTAALLATLAALLTTLVRILIWHDAYVSFWGKIPAVGQLRLCKHVPNDCHIFIFLELSNKARYL
jgi:hypothetical protein